MYRVLFLALFISGLVGCSTKEPIQNFSNMPSGQNAGMSDFEIQMFQAVNAERVKAGQSPLGVLSTCVQMAKDHAIDMITRGYFSHDSPTETFQQRAARYGLTGGWVGENIATGNDVAGTLSRWMNSSGHRANILSSNFRSTGVGFYQGDWVQCFSGYTPDR